MSAVSEQIAPDEVTQQFETLQIDPALPRQSQGKQPQGGQRSPGQAASVNASHTQPYQPYAQAYTRYPQQYQNPYPSYVPYSPYGPEQLGWRQPGSEQPSPINPSNPTFGVWSSPPVSPAVGAPPPFLNQQSRHGSFDAAGMPGGSPVYFDSRSSFGGPGPAWPYPAAPSHFGYYPSYHPSSSPLEPNMAQPSNWSGSPATLYGTGPNQNRVSVSSASRPSPTGTDSKEPERKPYHPQPPSRRSDWVMWVGNVPSNTSHEELWHFFNMTVPITDPITDTEPWRGPSSIFLISRSSCAFVNLSSQAELDRAVAFFNGKPLRPWDARCPRMVCRVRRKDDDLKSGVGAQRGTGIHRDWVKKEQEKQQVTPQGLEPVATAEGQVPAVSLANPAISELSDEGRKRDSSGSEDGKKASGSYASTSSSFLIKHFPRRVFIVKSLTTAELEESVRTGIWRTQRHNEPILDQAFRTSQSVFLIFGANRAGEFFGYARMVEPIDKERAKRQQSSISSSAPMRSGTQESSFFLAPQQSRITVLSPGELHSREDSYFHPIHRNTDPPKIPNHAAGSNSMSLQVLDETRAHTFDPKTLQRDYFPSVTLAMAQEGGDVSNQSALTVVSEPQAVEDLQRKETLPPPQENAKRENQNAEEGFSDDGWGHAFRIEWVKVAPLPFNKTRHLRNPWNADREVKVSRDGTEIEPSVGLQLMAEWDKPEIAPRLPSNGSNASSSNR
ncbi:hypothetical protein, variant [Cryptococcus amylolentus CBS 6039]|uniref:YTH domain-containing protein n=2 Tax=Cryptococcus amylolentus TaxID=104669 RepID=A0A1E3I0T1_9TREE|nr:hypothetical protein L202_02283 [Cryptococcus amylolentus CBS 6039]XP_018996264.1 hypothetical protein, variant [Cryptococcus amylolentus CBS 6039]ODN81944.1 hypothetical protein L202_02283 [Cryptococcus amylolentus CBS 6039]ODN81945.1 hypothetical protein, variant [Cryptococcus amylolentus CBS 6039]ODO09909.1 hypothetical protein I350_02132 [Cryptococcus amylolentus CBS 6273]